MSVCIWGQQTGFSKGEYHSLKFAIIDAQFVEGRYVYQPTAEYAITKKNGDLFAQHGDSGSLVFTNNDPEHRVPLGMIIGGMIPSQGTAFAFFTQMDYLLPDIKYITGASDIRFK